MQKVVIIGFNQLAQKLTSYLEEDSLNIQIVGYCENERKVTELSRYPILSSIDNAVTLSKQHGISDIYSTIPPEQDSRVYNIIRQAENACIHFRLVPDLSVFIKQPVHISYLKDIPVLTLRKEPLTNPINRSVKRIIDVSVSLFVIVFILSWLVPLLSIIIVIESRGPVFFIQQRTGRNNKPFGCMKFRSMKLNTDADTRQASLFDDRITRIGRFLRRTSIDEFPQFINVLKGEMSVVGPRPHMLKHTEDYSVLINQYMVRQLIKPGVTGWAQVNGLRGETQRLEQMKRRVEYDIWYMENWRFLLDIRIIFLTVYTTITGSKHTL